MDALQGGWLMMERSKPHRVQLSWQDWRDNLKGCTDSLEGLSRRWWFVERTSFFVRSLDAASNCHKDTQIVPSRHESEKKKLYADACVETYRHFTHLVYSVDRLEECEPVAARKHLALAAKWNR